LPFASTEKVVPGVRSLLETSESDWNSYETSLEFSENPLVALGKHEGA